jgi:hypothetical protein
MPLRFTSKDFWREKRQSLSLNKQKQGDASQHRTIDEESCHRQNNQEIEMQPSPNTNSDFLANSPLPIRSDDEVQDATKTTAQGLWRTAFRNIEQQHSDLMRKFQSLMIMELNATGHTKPTNLNAQDDWDIMEMFISRQVASILSPKKEQLYNGLDEAFRILKGIIEMINEPIKLVPQAAAPWAGVNVAVIVSKSHLRRIALYVI